MVGYDNVNNDVLPDVREFYLVLIAKEFHPLKYEKLGRVLSKCYARTGSPVELVKPYLSVFTTGTCSSQENGTFVTAEYDERSGTKVKGIGIGSANRTVRLLWFSFRVRQLVRAGGYFNLHGDIVEEAHRDLPSF